jgi:hypothetical protein
MDLRRSCDAATPRHHVDYGGLFAAMKRTSASPNRGSRHASMWLRPGITTREILQLAPHALIFFGSMAGNCAVVSENATRSVVAADRAVVVAVRLR